MADVSIELVIIVLLVLINGIFAMSEVALLSARKTRLQHLANRGNQKARRALALLDDPNNFLSTVQIGVTIVGVLSGAFAGATLAEQIASSLRRYPSLAQHAEWIGISIVVIGITYLSLILGELVPKRIALHNPERIATFVARPMSFVSRFAAPIVAVLSASTNAVLWIFRLKPTNEPSVTQDDVRAMIRLGTQVGVIETDEQQIVERVFRVGDRKVSALMTHRINIDWLDVNDPPQVLHEEVRRSRYLFLPVCDGDLDRTLGIVSAKDYLAAAPDADIRSLLKPAIFVPEGLPALKLLERFRNAPVPIALVIDEYGGVNGLVNPIDVLEALVGDLPGENPPPPSVVQRQDGSWLADGSLPLEDFKELIGADSLPKQDVGGFQTLAGFLIYHLGRIPKPADSFEFDGVHIEVVDMDGNRIDKLLVVSKRGQAPTQ